LDSSPDLNPFLIDLDLDLGSKDSDLDLKAMDLDLDLEALPASPFFKSFVQCTYKKHTTQRDRADPGSSTSSTQNDIDEPPPKRQKLFANYTVSPKKHPRHF